MPDHEKTIAELAEEYKAAHLSYCRAENASHEASKIRSEAAYNFAAEEMRLVEVTLLGKEFSRELALAFASAIAIGADTNPKGKRSHLGMHREILGVRCGVIYCGTWERGKAFNFVVTLNQTTHDMHSAHARAIENLHEKLVAVYDGVFQHATGAKVLSRWSSRSTLVEAEVSYETLDTQTYLPIGEKWEAPDGWRW